MNTHSDDLLEELIEYEDCLKLNELLNKELLSLSGKNDEESIKRINEIGKEYAENNEKLNHFDKDKMSTVQRYDKLGTEFKKISDEIKTIEQLSKKFGPEKKADTLTAEGRKIKIEKSLVNEYNELVKQKNNLRDERLKLNRAIGNIDTTKLSSNSMAIDTPANEQNRTFIAPKATFYRPVDLPERTPLTLPKLNDTCNKHNVELKPMVKTNLKYKKQKTNTKKSFFKTAKKKTVNAFKRLVSNWNIDKRVQLGMINLKNKGLDTRIKIKNKYCRFKDGVKQKYNGAKSFVATKKKIVKAIFTKGESVKETMEREYGSNKDKHLDYRIVNRAVNFKNNTVQRVSSMAGKLVDTSKKVVEAIKKPFQMLRDSRRDMSKRAELEEEIRKAKEATKAKTRVLKGGSPSAGYIATGAIIVIGVLILATIIFFTVGSIVNR